ncbi:Hypothetical protein R9X50_00546800 [Acrodontium crateriforme]|uniref:CCR4-NOT transcription complex subunit 4 n=1 Tax=Acrodontium crateriforme TaxID=150365 RepID=A0AAQ3M9D1_9PEZI|nr:Hypothetical protein R9X50_00546800 [Acrodontium crateriforme]
MSRTLQDQFIDDDEEETCPLCVEEFDLTDKGFRPCPCGYQICQFCYHNVKNNMNGLCPACRRPYDEKNIEYKVITPEETAAHRARQALKQKKTQAALQKEKQKAEADHLSRKHLAGLRVVQKNLVYVTGLSPTSQEDQLLQTLRGDSYFGQYGKIIKIVVSKPPKDPTSPHSVGVYVTYERKEDAQSCITAVNGSKNGERTLRAQFGTTKYCSAYLRNETCTNRNCMFLHEPGEANESYSRADLSALNAGSTQHGDGGRPPPPQSQQPVASAAPLMARQASSDQPSSPTADRPALPSTASWASKPPPLQSSRAGSRSTSGNIESPAVTNATPATAHLENATQETADPPVEAPTDNATISIQPLKINTTSPLLSLLKNFSAENFKFSFSFTSLPEGDLEVVKNFPPLFDEDGGAKRRVRRQHAEEQRRMEQEVQSFQQPPDVEPEDNPEMSGSLQLGGEPEERGTTQSRPLGQEGILDQRFQFGGGVSSPGSIDRVLTPQQQQQLLQTIKGTNEPGSYINSGFQVGAQGSNAPTGHQRNVSRYSFANDASASTAVKPVASQKLINQQSSIMPQAGSNQFGNNQQFFTSNVQGPPPGLKTTGTPPVSGGMTFGQGHGFATGGLQYGVNTSGRNANEEMMRNLLRGREGGIDAAAKRELNFTSPNNFSSTAAYPQSTANTFAGQQYGFDGSDKQRSKKKGKRSGRHANTSSSVSSGADGNVDSHLLQARLQGAGAMNGFGGQAAGAVGGMYLNSGLHGAGSYSSGDSEFPPLGPPSRPSSISFEEIRRSTPPVPPGFEAQIANESRRSTPSIPPGLSKPSALPNFDDDGIISRPGSRPSSRSSLRRQPSQVLPALPLRPGTPLRNATPTGATTAKDLKQEVRRDLLNETPTKPPRGLAKDRDSQDLSVEKDAKVVSKTTTTEGSEDLSQDVDAQAAKTLSSLEAAKPTPGMQVASKENAAFQSNEDKALPKTPSKSDLNKDEKRKRPGKLDITAAVIKQDSAPLSMVTPIETETPSKQKGHPTQSPSVMSKVPESPSGSIASPFIRNPPRTLRVVHTPKPETPPPQPTAALATSKLSRQPSLASLNHPGTPTSEHVSMSDNISMTSTSQSRANSPPPTRVGSAPVRTKTKNQMKKDRVERAKAIEEEKLKEENAGKEVDNEPAQEAIISRKKKTKKEKEAKPKPTAAAETKASSKQSTAVPAPKVVEEKAKPTVPVKSVTEKKVNPAPMKETTAPAPQPTVQPQTRPLQSPHEPSPPATPTLSAATLLAELKQSNPDLQKCIESLFRTPTNAQFKPSQSIQPKDIQNPENWKSDFGLHLTKDDVEALLHATIPAVRYGGEDGRVWGRGMVTPSGVHLRALTEELESRFLELERALRDMPEDLHFHPSKPQNELKFPHIDLEALKRQFDNAGGRGVSVMEQMVQDGASMKKGAFLVDEASKYINEFVMPPATPPPSNNVAGNAQHASNTGHVSSGAQEGVQVGLEMAERQLHEARRVADEKETALRKIIKKNKRLLGLA